MKENKLKPCPFCGEYPSLNSKGNGVTIRWVEYSIECHKCKYEGFWSLDIEEITKKWNDRKF